MLNESLLQTNQSSSQWTENEKTAPDDTTDADTGAEKRGDEETYSSKEEEKSYDKYCYNIIRVLRGIVIAYLRPFLDPLSNFIMCPTNTPEDRNDRDIRRHFEYMAYRTKAALFGVTLFLNKIIISLSTIPVAPRSNNTVKNNVHASPCSFIFLLVGLIEIIHDIITHLCSIITQLLFSWIYIYLPKEFNKNIFWADDFENSDIMKNPCRNLSMLLAAPITAGYNFEILALLKTKTSPCYKGLAIVFLLPLLIPFKLVNLVVSQSLGIQLLPIMLCLRFIKSLTLRYFEDYYCYELGNILLSALILAIPYALLGYYGPDLMQHFSNNIIDLRQFLWAPTQYLFTGQFSLFGRQLFNNLSLFWGGCLPQPSPSPSEENFTSPSPSEANFTSLSSVSTPVTVYNLLIQYFPPLGHLHALIALHLTQAVISTIQLAFQLISFYLYIEPDKKQISSDSSANTDSGYISSDTEGEISFLVDFDITP